MGEAPRVFFDAGALTATCAGKATHLLTLDPKHFLGPKTREANLPIAACTPREFLGVILE